MNTRNPLTLSAQVTDRTSAAGDPAREEERALLARCQAGEASAFEELVKKYEKKVYWISYNLVGNADDAEDLAQEAFIRVFRSLDRFNLKYNFYTWLYRIVVNLSIDHLRKHRRHVPVSLDELPEDPRTLATPDKAVEAKEMGDDIVRVLASLPEKYRTVLVLRDVEELDCAEIAKIIHCTGATTRWRLHRARELFADAWARLEPSQALSDA